MTLDSYYVPLYHYFTGPKLTVTERVVHCTLINYLFVHKEETQIDITRDDWKYFYDCFNVTSKQWDKALAGLVEKKYIRVAVDKKGYMQTVRVLKFPDPRKSKKKTKKDKTERRWVK